MGGAALADFGYEGLLIFLHFVDESLVLRALVGSGPEDHFGEDRGEVEALGSKEVEKFAAIGGIGASGDDAVGFEATETVGEDVGGGMLVGVEEFLEGTGAEEHHVADDEQGPAIAEHFDGGVQRTPGAPFRDRLGSEHRK